MTSPNSKKNQFGAAVSSIPGIVDMYLTNNMNEAIKTAIQLQSDRLKDEEQAENEDFINKHDTINEQLEAEILTRLSNEAKTSHAVAANLSKIELKKILIDKMVSNKSIYRSDQQKTLYKALVDSYESGKLILDTYRDTITIKRRQDDQDEDEEPSTGSNRGSKIRRAGKEPESTSAPKEKTSKSSGKSKEGSQSHNMSTGKSAQAEEPIHDDKDLEEPTHHEFDTRFIEDQPNNPEGQQYPHDLRKPLPLIPNSQGRRVIPFDHFINNDLAYLRGGSSSQTYATSVTKTKAADYGHVKWIEDLVLNTMWSLVPVIYDKHKLWGISQWGQKFCRNDDKLYTFKEGDHKRLRLQDIKDMLLLLVQGKLTNLTIEEHLALNVSLRISDLKRLPTYSAYLNPRVFIYNNKDKKNKLMRIDELHKFSNGTLNDVRTALDDILKRIRMKYLPQMY
ncbi:hypothetical protein Tco_0901577 [Tanacetum coccineum]